MNEQDAQVIISTVTDAFTWSLTMFSFEDIIDCCELTPKEKRWAKKNLDWKIVKQEETPINTDLLAACEDLVEWWSNWMPDEAFEQGGLDALLKGRSAIARAKGEAGSSH